MICRISINELKNKTFFMAKTLLTTSKKTIKSEFLFTHNFGYCCICLNKNRNDLKNKSIILSNKIAAWYDQPIELA